MRHFVIGLSRQPVIGSRAEHARLLSSMPRRVIDANIAECYVPVSAEVHDIKVTFIEKQDDLVNPIGIKGLVKSASWGLRR
jgi:xanthine dehydrogenase YagR molybdenum-binding subunit